MSMWDSYKKSDDAFSGTSMSLRCYEKHPVLKLGKGKLYGGSASHPVIKDADVYVALQSGSTSGRTSDPWDDKHKIIEVHHSITDMCAPSDTPRFKKLVTWICNQLQNGKTVHVGCIGGHGRTGTVLSAIVAEMKGEKNAIQWVRKHYCKKAVESTSQVQFLMKHYGVSSVVPTKGSGSGERKYSSIGFAKDTKWDGDVPPAKTQTLKLEAKLNKVIRLVTPDGVTTKSKVFTPMPVSSRSVWKKRKS